VPEFSTRDPSEPEFWDERYRAGFMPWDAHGIPAELAAFVERGAGQRVLVPGCGSAYEVALLDARGHAVTAIDIAPEALARARAVLGPQLAARVLRQADFFALTGQYDWIYERAFLCALPPAWWQRYAEAAARLLSAGGLLAGYFFVDDEAVEPRRGPPFSISRTELDRLLAADFDLIDDRAVPAEQSIPVFAGRERWMVWQRQDDATGLRGER
jgi:SAM-dependent methyltransferase